MNWLASADTTGEAFSDYLVSHAEDVSPNYENTPAGTCNVANWFFRNRGISATYSASVSEDNITTYIQKISSDRPVILRVANHPSYTAHAVVGYGYTREQIGTTTMYYAIVNNGWGSNGILISWSYITHMLYFNI